MRRRITTECFIEKAIAVHIDRYDYSLAEYNGPHVKIRIVCKDHGIFEQTPNFHLRSFVGCPKCSIIQRSQKRSLTKEQFIEKSIKLHGHKYDYSLVEYVNAFVDVIIICPEHGQFIQTANDHMNGKGRGCRKCRAKNISLKMKGKKPVSAGKNKSNVHDFIKKANEVHSDKYDYSLAIYLRKDIKVGILCSKHGIFEQTPHDHLQGCGCPKCSLSKGEIRIEQFLKDNNIDYLSQHSFSDLKSKSSLKFDFCLPDYNILIEYDGEQHFKYNAFFHRSDKSFDYQKEKDCLKEQYCKKNNIKLIRIPYWELDNIEKILSECLVSLTELRVSCSMCVMSEHSECSAGILNPDTIFAHSGS